MPLIARNILIAFVIALAVAAIVVHLRHRHHRPRAIRLPNFEGHTADLNEALKGRPAPWQPDPDTGVISYQNSQAARAHHRPSLEDLAAADELRPLPVSHRRRS